MTIQRERTIARLTAEEGVTYQVGPEWVTIKVSGSQTNDAYLVVDVTTPAGGGPPLHIHSAAEVFFVTDGSFEFPTLLNGEARSVTASTGEVVHIPGGVPHTYKNVGQGHGRLMGVLMPASEMEGFFQDAGTLVTGRSELPRLDAPLDLEQLFAACQKHHIEFLPPSSDATVGEDARDGGWSPLNDAQ